MTPVHIFDSKPVAAPRDWDEAEYGKCSTIHVRSTMIDGLHFLQSGYEPTPKEMALLQAGGKLILGINCRQHPVIHMFVDQPPVDPDVKPLPAYNITQEMRGDGSHWCICIGVFGEHSFRATIEIGNSLSVSEASSRLISAVESHATQQRWI